MIYIQMRNISAKNDSNKLFYCSMLTDWNDRDCSKAEPMCTMPGPIFSVKKDQPIEVAWVYDIDYNNKDTQNKTFAHVRGDECYIDGPKKPHCTLIQKNNNAEICIQNDTTQLNHSLLSKSYKISRRNIPTSVHIHGLEVRPNFDGNPMSWLGGSGSVGPAFQTLTSSAYFNSGLFRKKEFTNLRQQSANESLYMKVNRYNNFQPAGNLWYHDHGDARDFSQRCLRYGRILHHQRY